MGSCDQNVLHLFDFAWFFVGPMVLAERTARQRGRRFLKGDARLRFQALRPFASQTGGPRGRESTAVGNGPAVIGTKRKARPEGRTLVNRSNGRPGSSISISRRSSPAGPVEMVVHAEADDIAVEGRRVARGRELAAGLGAARIVNRAEVRRIGRAEVIIEIFGLDAPSREEHPLDAGAGRPSRDASRWRRASCPPDRGRAESSGLK